MPSIERALADQARRIQDHEDRVKRLETLEFSSVYGFGGCFALLDEQVIGGAGISVITFTAIPQFHRHLYLLLDYAADTTTIVRPRMTINNDTGASQYDYFVYIHSEGLIEAEIKTADAFAEILLATNAGSSPAPWFSSGRLLIGGYAIAGRLKTWSWEGWARIGIGEISGNPEQNLEQGGGLYVESDPVTRLDFTLQGGLDWTTGSRISLYGLC